MVWSAELMYLKKPPKERVWECFNHWKLSDICGMGMRRPWALIGESHALDMRLVTPPLKRSRLVPLGLRLVTGNWKEETVSPMASWFAILALMAQLSPTAQRKLRSMKGAMMPSCGNSGARLVAFSRLRVPTAKSLCFEVRLKSKRTV